MRKHRFHLIEKNRTYSTVELANRLKVHPRTIQEWCKKGLPRISEVRPWLFKGDEIKAYLIRKKKQTKIPLGDGEFYCVKCHKAVEGVAGSQTIKIGKKMGKYTQYLLQAICKECGCKINRVTSSKSFKIEDFGCNRCLPENSTCKESLDI